MMFEYHLKIVTDRNLNLERLTVEATTALADAGIIGPGDYVENPNCGRLDYEDHPNGVFRARVVQ